MESVLEAVEAELGALGAPETLAAAARLLAAELDADPGADTKVKLARELRMTMAEARAGAGVVSEIDDYLARIAAPELGHPGL